MAKYELAGYKVQRTGRGHDFKATKRDPFTGRTETKYVEVKTGDSGLSHLQKKKKRQFGKRYVVEREHTMTEALRTTSSRRKSSSGWFGTGTAPKTAKSKKPSGSLLGLGGTSGSLFGSTKAKKVKKPRKSSGESFGLGGTSGSLFGPSKTRRTSKSGKSSGESFGLGGTSGSLFGSTKKKKTTKPRRPRGSLL